MSALNENALKMQADAAHAAASSRVGTLLCTTRMRMGRDLHQVADTLHIRYNYLVAMEDGRYEDLPGQAYAIGFVRAYADHLGLDGDEIVRRYKEESSGLKNRPVFEFPLPTPDSGVPSGALILMALLLGMTVYGVWYAIAGSDRGAVEIIQAVPERLSAEQTAPTEDVVVQPSEDIATAAEGGDSVSPVPPLAPPLATGTRDPSVAGEADLSAGPRQPDEPETSVATPNVTPSPQVAALPPAPVDVVELRAKADVWITLKAQGQADRTQMMKKGETLRAPEGGTTTLITAKPSDLDILINGSVMPPLDAGVFAKGVPLDPAQFKATPAPAAPAAAPQ
jgi:cytoskeleton protein RodZ